MKVYDVVDEYLDESWWAGDVHDSVESVFADCVLYASIVLAPFQVNEKAVLQELLRSPYRVAQLVR